MHIRGALVEYSDNFLGPLPNIVIFQFNPEQLTRNFTIAQRNAPATSGSAARAQEPRQTSSPPSETFTLTAHFSAADDLGEGGAFGAIARVFGIGPQLAALEKMIFPPGSFAAGSVSVSVDAVGDAVSAAASTGSGASQAVPREPLPKVLFIWGPGRVLPVEITSLSFTEQKYDFLLNPVQAQVDISMAVVSYPASGTSTLPPDPIGQGALKYTQALKDAQAVVNLANVIKVVPEIIPF